MKAQKGPTKTHMKTIDRRATPRCRVQFRTIFAGPTRLEGSGVMLDLSAQGCRVETTVIPQPGWILELLIHAPDLERPLMIKGACVQWVCGQAFGLIFLRISNTEQQRWEQVVGGLMEDSSVEEFNT